MEVSDRIRKFILDNAKLINNNEFEILYSLLNRRDGGITRMDISNFTQLLYEADIDPLEHVDIIPKYFLYRNRSVTTFIIPNNVWRIGSDSFRECEELTSVQMGEGITEIGTSAFRNCKNLNSINIPDSVTEIGEYAFDRCEGLEVLTIGRGVSVFGDRAFSLCGKLTQINYNAVHAADLHETNSQLFINAGITEKGINVIFGKSVKVIPENLFFSGGFKINVTSVDIPSSVEKVNSKAFFSCENLETVNYGGTRDQWMHITEGSIQIIPQDTKVICKDGNLKYVPSKYVALGGREWTQVE